MSDRFSQTVLSPLRGLACMRREPTADAVGYDLPVLRTSNLAS